MRDVLYLEAPALGQLHFFDTLRMMWSYLEFPGNDGPDVHHEEVSQWLNRLV